MRIIDPHVHMYSRVTEDYERMAMAGIEAVVEPAFWLGSPRTSAGTFADYFEHIIGFEAGRARQYGVRHFSCISLNPREANNVPLARQVLPVVETFCQRETVVGIGEVGFDQVTDAEEEALRAQLRIAKRHQLPVLIHLPHQYKKVGTERSLQVVADEGLDPDRTLFDHNTEETMPLFAGTKYWRGMTVYYVTKLTAERAANIVEQYGTDRLLVNSSCDWGHSDPLAVPKVVQELKRRQVGREQIEQLVFRNPIAFFGQSERWTFRS